MLCNRMEWYVNIRIIIFMYPLKNECEYSYPHVSIKWCLHWIYSNLFSADK
jgi:hypothetical protein